VLRDGVAVRGSLRSGPEALRLEDVLNARGPVLFRLDVADYPHATRKVASWVLLGMGRLARQMSTPSSTMATPRALLLVDEVAHWARRHGICKGWWVGRARPA
jgi:hypothetical protein